MGIVVDFQQSCGVDTGIDLGGGKAGMAEQFLNGTQIAAAGQKMGGEGMAQGMWRRIFRQAESAAQFLHLALYDGGLQLAAARTEE